MSTAVQKADMILSDLASGGLLTVEQSERFIRQLIEQPTILNQARTIAMSNPSYEISRTKFGSRILQAGEDATGARDIYSGSRALPAANRSKPTNSKITLNAKEYIAEVRLPYEVLEDNIERGDFYNTVIAMIAGRVATDMEELLISSDTASGTPVLALQNGILARSTSNVVDAAGATISIEQFMKMMKAMPKAYRGLTSQMRFFVPRNVELDYKQQILSRQTSLGDQALQSNITASALGVPVVGVDMLPDTNVLLTVPANLLVGIYRNIRFEYDKDISTREFKIVVTMRAAFHIEEEPAVVKMTNLAIL